MIDGDLAVLRVVSMRDPMPMRFAVAVHQQRRDTTGAIGLGMGMSDWNQRQSPYAERQVHGKGAAASHCGSCYSSNAGAATEDSLNGSSGFADVSSTQTTTKP